MAPPTGRVLALLELLQTTTGATAAQLAGRLNVDERTIRRDAAHLRDLGIPVATRRGRNGGIGLVRGYRLPPLMLSDAEAVSVVLGLAALGAPPGTPVLADRAAAVRAAAVATLDKINRLLPAHLAAQTAADAPDPSDPADPPDPPDLSGPSDPSNPSNRSVPSVPSVPESEVAWAHEVEITLGTTLDRAVARIPSGVARLIEEPGGVRLVARVSRLDGVALLLAGLGWPFVIHRPQALRVAVAALAGRLADSAAADSVAAGRSGRSRASAWASVWPSEGSSARRLPAGGDRQGRTT
jgi:hypothetical protein